MEFDGAVYCGRSFETVRWQDKWNVIEALYKRGGNDVAQKHHMKKKLHPILALNSRGIEFEMPNSRVTAPSGSGQGGNTRKKRKKGLI